MAPSLNVVVYNGNRNVRKLIQALEFYEEGGCIMFEVLLTCPSIVVEVSCILLVFIVNIFSTYYVLDGFWFGIQIFNHEI